MSVHGDSFARLTLTLAEYTDRRQVSGLVMLSGLLALLGLSPEAEAKRKKRKKRKCSSGFTKCVVKRKKKKKKGRKKRRKFFCANLQTDRANCGACGHACASEQTCNSGVCTSSSGGCVPDTTPVSCAGTCGPVLNSCGQEVQCGGRSYVYERSIGISAEQDGILTWPHGVAVDSTGDVFVVDRFRSQVLVFNAAGVYQRVIG